MTDRDVPVALADIGFEVPLRRPAANRTPQCCSLGVVVKLDHHGVALLQLLHDRVPRWITRLRALLWKRGVRFKGRWFPCHYHCQTPPLTTMQRTAPRDFSRQPLFL